MEEVAIPVPCMGMYFVAHTYVISVQEVHTNLEATVLSLSSWPRS